VAHLVELLRFRLPDVEEKGGLGVDRDVSRSCQYGCRVVQ
jgi:hypothetical protein